MAGIWVSSFARTSPASAEAIGTFRVTTAEHSTLPRRHRRPRFNKRSAARITLVLFMIIPLGGGLPGLGAFTCPGPPAWTQSTVDILEPVSIPTSLPGFLWALRRIPHRGTTLRTGR